ncbi:MAG TPA: DpnI domain-containing protein [Agitococcus sp.]|nr:DpnI domain-containing protein [Agitococcus sp.]
MMDLNFKSDISDKYTSKSQIARILTEKWMQENAYCLSCGNSHLSAFENNRPVADYFCSNCNEEYELKSKIGTKTGSKIVDGAYSTMIERVSSNNNPNLFFMNYCNIDWKVNSLMIIPKYYFIEDIIEKRKPLSISAKRAGWVGCNINISKIPEVGKIYLIKDSVVINKNETQEKWQQTCFLKLETIEARGWLLDLMRCIETIPNSTFTLAQVYSFERYLQQAHPSNNHIKDKIRQQLQNLRDKGVIGFLGGGKYIKNT